MTVAVSYNNVIFSLIAPVFERCVGYATIAGVRFRYVRTIRTATKPRPSRLVAIWVAQTLVRVLQQCGDNLTRENVMGQAANLKDLEFGMLLPGIEINTSPSDFAPIKQMQMMRFNGESWERFGHIMSGGVGG
jgi:hypothetical protein